MNIKSEVKEYSTKKLKEIIEYQANAYSEEFIDFAKNELVRRGEAFIYDVNMAKQVKELTDDDLRKLVEIERANYHLEYLELAIKEYLSRGFKNETGYSQSEYLPEAEPEKDSISENRYPALNAYSALYSFFGLVSFIDILFVLFYKMNTEYKVFLITLCLIGGITLLATAEAIKVFLSIEQNTRTKRVNR